ncbi:MAG: hypothetical protein ABEH64_07675 [Salinirussus sp.]
MTADDADDSSAGEHPVSEGYRGPVVRRVGDHYELVDRENRGAWLTCDAADTIDPTANR